MVAIIARVYQYPKNPGHTPTTDDTHLPELVSRLAQETITPPSRLLTPALYLVNVI